MKRISLRRADGVAPYCSDDRPPPADTPQPQYRSAPTTETGTTIQITARKHQTVPFPEHHLFIWRQQDGYAMLADQFTTPRPCTYTNITAPWTAAELSTAVGAPSVYPNGKQATGNLPPLVQDNVSL